MSDEQKYDFFDKYKDIRREAQLFREKCNQAKRVATQLCTNSDKLKNEIQCIIEEAVILEEETIASKCESMALLKLGFTEEDMQKSRSIYSSYQEEKNIVYSMLDKLLELPIDKTNTTLLQLREDLLKISFLPDSYFQERKDRKNPN